MRNTKKAFTLVELIVVITILAILGTIAFISLQGYSADARNSKRTSDLGNIQGAMSLKQVEGVPLMSFISGTSNALTGGANVGGFTGVTDSTKYTAGTPAYTVLNVIAKDFKDPKSDKEYRIGATTYAGGVFQVAATLEKDGTDTAQVNGTYNARTTASSNVSATGTADLTSFSLTDSKANTFKVGDKVKDSVSGTGYTVQKVSRDGVTLTLSASTTATGLTLFADESAGLIGDANTTTASGLADPVLNLSTTLLPY